MSALIEPEFALFQVPVEILGTNPIEPQQPPLRETPEALDPVDVSSSAIRIASLIMVDAMVLIAVEHQAVIGTPLVRIESAAWFDQLTNDRSNLSGSGVLEDLGVDPAASSQQTKDRDLGRATPTPAPVLAPKVALIQFDLSGKALLVRLLFLVSRDPLPKESVVAIDGVAIDPCQPSGLSGGEILAEAVQDLFHLVRAQFAILDAHSRLVYHISSSLEPLYLVPRLVLRRS